jgi:LPS export ABC transporter protein LptC
VLPDNPPDVYMTGMNLTRFNGTGQVEMKTEAESLAVYEADGVSLLAKPRVTLVTDSQDSWLITADEAQLFDNEDIEFKNSVVITQLNSTDPMMLTSEFLSVKNQGELVSTDLPVQIVKGSQVTNAIGMEVKLDTIKPIINLLSDVTFEYDPS